MDFQMRHDVRWLTIDDHVVRERWLDDSTQAVLARSPGAQPALEGPLREQLANLLVVHERLAPAAMYALYPSIDDGVVAIAQLLVSPAEPGLTLDDVLAAVVAPDGGPLELVQPAEVMALVGGAAPATRVRQRYVERTSERRRVADMVTYLWLVPEDLAVLVLSSTFYDPLLAARWIDVLDDLARGLRVGASVS
jgi:hypothetical protein